MPLGFGFGTSRDSSSSQSQSSSFVDPSQNLFLNFLRNQGASQFGGFMDMASLFGQQAQGLAGSAMNLGDNPFIQSLLQQSQGNPELVAQQTEQLGSDLGRFFNEQLVPGINQGGIQAGQFAQSRGDIGRGLAAQGVTDQFQRGATAFQQADQMRALQAGQFGGQLFGQGQQLQQQGLGQAFDFLQGGFGAQFDPLFALAQIFGDPTVLQQATASSQSSGSSFNASFSGA